MGEEKKEFVAGSGRPKLKDPSESKERGIHMIRAYDEEWELIKKFQLMTRGDIELCKKAMAILEYMCVDDKKFMEKMRKEKAKFLAKKK